MNISTTRTGLLDSVDTTCYHCGDPCESEALHLDDKAFCCHGCQTVYEILSENELCDYYTLEKSPGITQKKGNQSGLFDYLDDDEIKRQLLDFQSDNYERITLRIPNIHCSSCIWLLEHLNRLNPDVLDSKVDFVKKTIVLHYNSKGTSLRNLVELLDAIGYPPSINLAAEEENQKQEKSQVKQLIIKLGVAGFCFGNIMLLSFPDYLGLTGIEKTYADFFRWLNMLLAVPVVFYSGSAFLTSAVKSIRQRYTNIDVPIALGIVALFLRSSYEVIWNVGPGYFDSLVGLVFFLLIGKWFQAKTYETLSFERDYKSYFPLAIQKLVNGKAHSTPVKDLKKGDEILVRNNEIIPGDAILIDDSASIDYSFVTGESDPVVKKKGDYIYAGGRQVGQSVRLVIQKEISQGYLTRLWNDEAFSKEKSHVKFVDKVSRYFTLVIIGLAVLGAIFWQFTDPSKTWLVFTAVLIVACPCALALATPFTVGSVMRVFGKNRFYLKNADVVEKISQIDHIVFDKTGTLTSTDTRSISFHGSLEEAERAMVQLATSNSTHPLSQRISTYWEKTAQDRLVIQDYEEHVGKGILATVNERQLKIGSASFLGIDTHTDEQATSVHVSIDGDYKGYFELKNNFRPGISGLVDALKSKFGFSVISGDNEGQKSLLKSIFPSSTKMYFNRGPQEKLEDIKQEQVSGKKVLMLGDGLNDAGALKQSDIGIAVTESTSHFSPASDAIMEAKAITKLDQFLDLGKSAKRIIIISFLISVVYNIGGLSFALAGGLTPLIAAILMPLSSVSIVIFTTLAVRWKAFKLKLG